MAKMPCLLLAKRKGKEREGKEENDAPRRSKSVTKNNEEKTFLSTTAASKSSIRFLRKIPHVVGNWSGSIYISFDGTSSKI